MRETHVFSLVLASHPHPFPSLLLSLHFVLASQRAGSDHDYLALHLRPTNVMASNHASDERKRKVLSVDVKVQIINLLPRRKTSLQDSAFRQIAYQRY